MTDKITFSVIKLQESDRNFRMTEKYSSQTYYKGFRSEQAENIVTGHISDKSVNCTYIYCLM